MSEVGGPKLGQMNIGEEAKPRFAIRPDPASLIPSRSSAALPSMAAEEHERMTSA